MLVVDKEIIELEKVVIGAVMLEPNNCHFPIEKLRPEHFYDQNHKIIWSHILKLEKENKTIDIISVTQSINKSKQMPEIEGGAYYISTLADRVASTELVEKHSLILIEDFMRRTLWIMSNKLTGSTVKSGNDPFKLIEGIENDLNALLQGFESKPINQLKVAINAFNEKTEAILKHGKKSGVITNLISLDNHTYGWQPSDLIILAGRPGMGKTSAAMAFAYNASCNDEPTLFFSLEMSEEQLTGRILSHVSALNVQKVVQHNLNRMEQNHIISESQQLQNLKMFIDDTPLIKISELKNKARRMVKKEGIKLIIIDYLQLIHTDVGSNREAQISHISRSLKALAKELNVPIIALSQLSREVEKRPDKKPQLADLRESGAIEQDADMIIFCYRPIYYGFEEYHYNGERITGNELEQLFLFLIEKFRNGGTGEIRLKWIGETTSIKN